MPDTVTVYHPTIADVSTDVPAKDVDRWVEQGWRKTGETTKPKPKRRRKPAPKPPAEPPVADTPPAE